MSPIQSTSISVRYHSHETLMHSLETTFGGSMINDGVMFDIRSSPTLSVEIKSLSFHTEKRSQCDVEVYTKEGSHQYFEEARSAWILLVKDSIQCLGPDVETVVDASLVIDMDNLKIEKGSSRAFYIKLNGGDIVYSNDATSLNEVYVEDSHIQILVGTGLGGFFQDFKAPRMWNGRVTYEAETNSLHAFLGVCSRYLGSDSAETTNNNYGIVFDVRSKTASNLSIQGLTLETSSKKAVDYEIYMIPNGFEFGLGSMQNWMQPVAQGTGRADASGQLLITNIEDIKILPGRTVGLYVTLKTKTLLYHTTSLSVGSSFIQNDDIIVTVGVGVGTYPQKDTLYQSRGLVGQINYISHDSCDLESTVSYLFVIHYPNDYSMEELYDDIEFRIKIAMSDILREDRIVGNLKQTHNLEYQSVKLFEDNGNLGPCATSKKTFKCIRMTANVTLSHEDGADPGLIEFGLLRNTGKMTEDMNLGDLDVYYSGDEPLETRMILTIFGVPKKRMDTKEKEFFESSTKKFLNSNIQSEDVDILSVEVNKQSLADSLEGIGTTQKEISKNNGRLLEDVTTSIDIATTITGKHRPPSPGLNFDDLVEDSINAEDSNFKEELAKDITESGIDYFSNMEEIRATATKSQAPTLSPISNLGYTKVAVNDKGLGVVATLVIIISSAIITFALVFGAFVYHKRREEKKKFKLTDLDAEEDDEDDPLFFDMFKSRKNWRKDQPKKGPPKFAFTKKSEDNEDVRLVDTDTSGESFSRNRISTQEVVVDINGENYSTVDEPTPMNDNRSRRSFGRSMKRFSQQSSRRSGSRSDSQYNIRKSASSAYSRPASSISSLNDNEIQHSASQSMYPHESQRNIMNSNGIRSTARFTRSESNYGRITVSNNSFKSVDLDDHALLECQSRRSIFDQAADENSSVMSSSTNSTISTKR